MDTFLIALTVLSCAACAACGFLTWRTVDAEQRRSSARVAALAAAVVPDDEAGLKTGLYDRRGGPSGPPEPQAVSVSSMFGTKPGGSVSAPPFLKTAVVGALGLALVVVVAMTTGGHSRPAAPPAAPAPLELVAMTHTRNGNRLTVTGTVRNPMNGAPLGHIDAVISAVDRGGNVAATGSAPVDFLNLAPGDESPFVVTVPNAAAVSRYRISFRNGQSVLRHIDRRAQAQVAVN